MMKMIKRYYDLIAFIVLSFGILLILFLRKFIVRIYGEPLYTTLLVLYGAVALVIALVAYLRKKKRGI